jgi:hypothetical protein
LRLDEALGDRQAAADTDRGSQWPALAARRIRGDRQRVLSSIEPKALQRNCAALDDKKNERLLGKWLARPARPFDRRDGQA